LHSVASMWNFNIYFGLCGWKARDKHGMTPSVSPETALICVYRLKN